MQFISSSSIAFWAIGETLRIGEKLKLNFQHGNIQSHHLMPSY